MIAQRRRDDDAPFRLPWPKVRTAFEAVVKPAYVALRTASSRLVEWRTGIETEGNIDLRSLGCEAEGRVYYMPSGWTTLPRILPRRDVGPEDVFLDFGSGLGRVVFQAARYPFKRVVGVEVSEQLQATARANIDRNRERLRAGEVQLVTCDAATFEIPDDVTVAYLFNPFTGSLFSKVITNLLESYDRRPRRLRIIYRNPVEHEFLLSTGRVRVVRRLSGLRPTPQWSRSNATFLYEVTARS